MNYRKYKNYWYKLIDEEDFIYWKVSEKKDDRQCNIWIGDPIKISLDELINKIEQNKKFEDISIKLIKEHGVISFMEAVDILINKE